MLIVFISTYNDETVTNEKIVVDLKECVIKPVILEKYLDEKTTFHLNLFGLFVIDGLHGDIGLTDRKIIINTYRVWVTHDGGVFYGKDPTKIDRNGACMARGNSG